VLERKNAQQSLELAAQMMLQRSMAAQAGHSQQVHPLSPTSMAMALQQQAVLRSMPPIPGLRPQPVLGHTPLGHTPLGHTPLGHTPLGHTPLGHTPLGHTPLGHTPLGYTPLLSAPPPPSPSKRGPYRVKSVDESLWEGASAAGWKRHKTKKGAWCSPEGLYFESARAVKDSGKQSACATSDAETHSM